MDATEWVLQYLKIAHCEGIMLTATGDLNLKAYNDADWGATRWVGDFVQDISLH